ncbi:MAG TPA: DNA polymerase III subunit gamma/tau [Moraxellaceae bacterium]|nr:DNA polymerase III subunit gamma/tau [Moraxellaceae bacterium]
MSYQVLARKYRPRSFRELVGQEHVARALINALDQDRLHHAYLFTGTRGVGKTTIARILAKCLNCETGVSSEPCGVCATCREVDEGRFVDLIEVDAASRTKVEDTRELLDNVQYAPTRGRYKVYLIDEVHMLSNSSFNALLKTLEEPPPHVKFLLATTDPHKLPVTVLSRCLQFALKAMSPERVVEHLSAVLKQELVEFEDGALWELGRAANGSMRDALSLTDQAIAFGNGRLATADVRSMLGSIDRDLVFRVLEAVNTGDAAEVVGVCARLAEQSVDFAGALSEIISNLHRLALAQMLPDAIDNALGDRERVLAVAAAMTAEDVQLYYQIALQGRRDMPWAADPRSGFEMTLLRMLAFRPVGGAPDAAGQGAGTRAAAPVGARPAPRAGAGGAQAQGAPSPVARTPSTGGAVMAAGVTAVAMGNLQAAGAAPAMAPRVEVPPAPPRSAETPSNVVPLHPAAARPGPAVAATVPVRPAAPAPGVFHSPSDVCTPEAWEQWVQVSGLTGAGLNLARHAALVGQDDGRFELQLAPRHEIVASGQSFAQVEAAFQQHFPGTQLRLAKKDPAYTVPMQVIAQRKQARLADAEASLRNDPVVRLLMQDFQAEILTDSITPLD